MAGDVKSGWRLAAVIGEALANYASSRARTLVLLVGVGAMLAALSWAELNFSAEVKDQAQRFAAAGGYVAVVVGPAGLAASSCEQLRWDPRVVRAGGLRDGGQVTTSNAPGVPFQRYEVTGGMIEVLDPSAPATSRGGYRVGLAAAEELGLATGSWVSADGGPIAPAVVINPSARDPFAARAFIDLVPPMGQIDQCWVEFYPEFFEAGLVGLPAAFAPEEAEARRAVDRGEFSVDPAEVFAGRLDRWGWLPVGFVASAMIALMALFRRSESAVYRAFGLSRLGLLIMHQVETMALVAVALILASVWAGMAYAVAAGVPDLDQVVVALRTSGKAAALILIIGPMAGAWAAGGSPASLLKER